MQYGFVVEGFHDEAKVLRVVPTAKIVVLNSKFGNKAKMDLAQVKAVCDEVLLLTDPDGFGDTLASWVLTANPTMRRIHIDASKCLCYRGSKVKVGVEHCSNEYLLSVLRQYIYVA